jgi:alpha-glucuronidase
MKRLFQLTLLFLIFPVLTAEDGYRLWLRYDKITDSQLLAEYNKNITGWIVEGSSPVLNVTAKELQSGLNGLLGVAIPSERSVKRNGIIVAGTIASSPFIKSLKIEEKLTGLNDEGYIIISAVYKKKKVIVIAAKTDAGVLYGTFGFLRLMQTGKPIADISISSSPKIKVRILNHWDNLNRTVERGYAGLSLWDWKTLPDSVTKRYTDYARANASIGINSTVLTNVNANAQVLTHDYLVKVAALANVLRPYGIRVYLTARFSAPVEIGKLKTADPLDPEVINWWKKKAEEIYSLIPDFGGFTVKANSEGQPGPQNYKRSHAEGANLIADAVGPFGGIVMWRAFVYDNNVPDDRAKQAYNEFVPLDGKFSDNVIIQVKNGPVDFQPREPFSPLFGAMTKTGIMPELQITQEYLGGSVHLVYLGPLFEECLKSDTYARGKGTLVADVIDGKPDGRKLTAMAGVTNIGNVTNWCGHPFAQANWYAFGRLCWDPYLNSEEIADEWIRMTFTNNPDFVGEVKKIMMASREVAVNYMTPLGLHHIMYSGHHYGPGPWVDRGRQDWTAVYYHRADSAGIGFDRTTSGSNAVSQYFQPVRDKFNDLETCPDNLLLWFHHLPWDYKIRSGKTLWNEICITYQAGVNQVEKMKDDWLKVGKLIDTERYMQINGLMDKQIRDAKIWKNSCILYFQTFSRLPIPEGVEKPDQTLDFYRNYRYTDIPGISR